MKKLFALLFTAMLVGSIIGCCGSKTVIDEGAPHQHNCDENGCKPPYQDVQH